MKTVINQRDFKSILEQYSGAYAQIWLFHITHKRLALRLSKPNEAQVIYIIAEGQLNVLNLTIRFCNLKSRKFKVKQESMAKVTLWRDWLCFVSQAFESRRLQAKAVTLFFIQNLSHVPKTRLHRFFLHFVLSLTLLFSF
jgi:hypothetical protein